MHYFEPGDGVLVSWPRSSPPLLPAPPFTSPVVLEGNLYIAQETDDEVLIVGRAHVCSGTKESLVEMGRRGGSF